MRLSSDQRKSLISLSERMEKYLDDQLYKFLLVVYAIFWGGGIFLGWTEYLNNIGKYLPHNIIGLILGFFMVMIFIFSPHIVLAPLIYLIPHLIGRLGGRKWKKEDEEYKPPSLQNIEDIFDGKILTHESCDYRVRIEKIGVIEINSESIAVGDPLTGALRCLAKKVPNGKYDVTACMAVFDNDLRVAYLRVKLSDLKPKTFVAAKYGRDNSHTIGVDSGTIALADGQVEQTMKAYSKQERQEFEQKLLGKLNMESDAGSKFFTWEDMIVLESGFGDGLYPMYWGLHDKVLVALYIDLGILTQADFEKQKKTNLK